MADIRELIDDIDPDYGDPTTERGASGSPLTMTARGKHMGKAKS